jgi:acyl-CoA thioesterase I
MNGRIEDISGSILKLAFLIIVGFSACSGKKETEANATDPVSDTITVAKKQDSTRYIVCFGNSLTAGYGLEMEYSYPSVLQGYVDSLGLNYQLINAGLSGETSAGGKNRIDWVLNQRVDVFILELGANDGLRGIQPKETKKNLQEILAKVKTRYPDAKILIAGMMMPPSMGQEYTAEFRQVFIDLAAENNAILIPFFLEGVAGNPELNLSDGMHPNKEGYKIVVKNLWNILYPILTESNS